MKSCISTLAGWKGISSEGSAPASQVAIVSTSSAVTESPSSSRSAFSSSTLSEYGSRATSNWSCSASSRKISYSRPETSRVSLAPKLSLMDPVCALPGSPREIRAARCGRRPAKFASTRWRSGATSISGRSCSIARDDRVADLLGRGGAEAHRRLAARVGEHARVADEAGADRPRPRRRRGRGPGAGRARSPAAPPWSPCRARCRALAALPASEETNTIWPEPRARIAGASARAVRIGASRLTRTHALDCRPRELVDAPAARRGPALATSTSTSPASATSASAAPARARSATIAPVPVAGKRARRARRARRACASSSTSVAPRSASAAAIARPSPPVAPVSSAVRAARAPSLSACRSARGRSRRRPGSPCRRRSARRARAR